jgi:NADPH:quinone reductase-like Zn-dependent oxidoreductase
LKTVLIERYGEPAEVVRCAEVAPPGAPGPGEVLFDVLAFPINPADLWFCRGSYRLRPPLPATPGAECLGRVAAVGPGVTDLAVGDHVINLLRENWTQQRLVPATELVRVPPDIDPLQAAMLRINPPTAAVLIDDFAELAPGDWLVQNTANSSVGRWVVRLAAERGLRTVNIVRRPESGEALRALGADACVVDGPDLAARVAEATGNTPIRLGIDALGGTGTGRLAGCIADDATLVTYGSMSGEDPVIPRGELIYRGIHLTGCMLGRRLAKRDAAAVRALYARLAAMLAEQRITLPVRAVYPIEEIARAVAHADEGAREGKILVTPNGPVASGDDTPR